MSAAFNNFASLDFCDLNASLFSSSPLHRVFSEQCRPVLTVWLQQWQLPAPRVSERMATATPSEHAAFSPWSARVSGLNLHLRELLNAWQHMQY